MPAVEVGAVCEKGHFTYAFHHSPAGHGGLGR